MNASTRGHSWAQARALLVLLVSLVIVASTMTAIPGLAPQAAAQGGCDDGYICGGVIIVGPPPGSTNPGTGLPPDEGVGNECEIPWDCVVLTGSGTAFYPNHPMSCDARTDYESSDDTIHLHCTRTTPDDCFTRSTPAGPMIGAYWSDWHSTQPALEIDPEDPSEVDYIYSNVMYYNCIPPPSYRLTTVNCAWDLGLHVTGPFSNPTQPPISPTYRTKTPVSSAFKLNQTLDNCSLAASIYDTVPLEHYGRYLLEAYGTKVTCNVKVYTTVDARLGYIPPAEFLGCGAPYVAAYTARRAQVWCDGASQDWSGSHTFDQSECMGAGGNWQCGDSGWRNQVGRVEGVPAPTDRPYQTFADGQANQFSWEAPDPYSLTGRPIENLDPGGFRVNVHDDSNPWRDGLAEEHSDQVFIRQREQDSWVRGGTSTALAQYFEATKLDARPLDRWQMRPTWGFTGDFPFRKYTIHRVNFRNGGGITWTWEWDTTTQTVACQGPWTATEVKRARSDM